MRRSREVILGTRFSPTNLSLKWVDWAYGVDSSVAVEGRGGYIFKIIELICPVLTTKSKSHVE